MGTSASGAGAGGSNPLIPTWIGGGGGAPPTPLPQPPQPPVQSPQGDGNNAPGAPAPNNNVGNTGDTSPGGTNALQNNINGNAAGPNRFSGPRRNLNKFIKSGSTDARALRNALKGYSLQAAGSTQNLARRMQPSSSRVAAFYETINRVRDNGKNAALAQFNLASYQDKPLFEILSSLTDVIFRDTGKLYEDTQDDSITKQAYANTIVRICELDGIDLDSLSNDEIITMTSIFIEETIAQRVINDVGNLLTEKNSNVAELIAAEDNIYQIVSGLVRNRIMPEISVSQLGDRSTFNTNVENIYRIAFDAIAGIN